MSVLSSVQWRLENSTTMIFNCLRNKPLYIVILYLPNSSICDLDIDCQFLSPFIFLQDSWEWGALLPLSVSSQSNRLLWRQKRAAPPRLRWIKYCPAGVCYQGCCLSVFQCVPQELPSILPLCAAQIAYFARTRLRIKLCHVLHAQTWDFLCLLWTPCHVLVLLLCWFYKGFF